MFSECEISIITPVYNTPKMFLDEYWAPIVKLAKEINIEVIMVDDGSSAKETKNWLEEHSDFEYLHIITLPYNRGISYARNTALGIAKGSYLLIIDSDDYIHNVEGLIEMYKTTVADDCDICFAPHIYRLGDETCSIRFKSKEKKLLYELEGVTASARLTKLDLIRKNRIYYPEQKLLEDPCFNIFVVMVSEKIRYYDDSFLTVRKHEGSTSKQKTVFQNMKRQFIPLEYIENNLFDYSKIKNMKVLDVHEGELINLLAAICCVFVDDDDRRSVVSATVRMMKRIKHPLFVSTKYLVYGETRIIMRIIQFLFSFAMKTKLEYLFSSLTHRILIQKS